MMIDIRIDGGKYRIKQDVFGYMSILRDDQPWIEEVQPSAMLSHLAYELHALRRLCAAAIAVQENKMPLSDFSALRKELNGLVDFERDLLSPGIV